VRGKSKDEEANMILLSQKVAYRGTISGLRISSVDGAAFIDACADLVPYADGNHLVEIYDASGRMLRGYLGAAGDGEDLGPEIVDAWANGATIPYETWTVGAGNLITQAVNSSGSGVANKTVSPTLYALYKCVNAITLTSETMPTIRWRTVSLTEGNTFTSNATSYQTINVASEGNVSIISTAATDFALTSFSLKKVTGPSTSGAVIVSAKGGATENFAYKSASFTFNQASYQVIVRAAR
jgi:hypothetical protein